MSSAIETASAGSPPAVQRPSSLKMIGTLGSVAMVSGLLIVCTYQVTLPGIQANKRAAIESAVFKVLPGAETSRTFQVEGDGFTAIEGENPATDKVYTGYDESGKLIGVAIEAKGQGYAGDIKVIFGYSPDRQCVIGFEVLESNETPGLGDRIAKDPAFLVNFDGLAAQVNADGTGLAHAIQFVKNGEKTDPWQIDGITGATISSTAVASMINGRSQTVIPAIMKHLDDLKESN
jgi:H+/Na+-translocating ferredoxin:NAD+ oxidoreductase subunit G